MSEQEDFYEWRNLSVGLTTSCNLRCKMCPVIRRKPGGLAREQALHVADFAQRRGFERIVVGGGEPTILPYFWEFMDSLAGSDIEIWLLTNAFRFGEEHVRRLASNPRILVNISIDGVGEVHDNIRGKGTFASTARSLEMLLEAGCRCAVNTVVQRSNYRTMLELDEWTSGYPLEWHGFTYAESFYGDAELVPPEKIDESLGVLAEVCRRNKARNGKAVLSQEMLNNLRLSFKYPRLTMHPGRDCTVPRRLLSINEYADVLSCWHFPWNRGPHRDLNRRSLDEIVDDPMIRREVSNAIGPHGCVGCTTMCYFWDEDFRSKTMHPTGLLRARRVALHAKEHLRVNHPKVFEAARGLRASLARRHG